ncbi:MAG: hypothetical protein LC723_12765 [Actinobacteria bacterium]|nr:hypothetical protein [Actinomycetota bacterium]
MFEDLTDQARNAIALAGRESKNLGHEHTGTEHFLLAILRIQDCAGRLILEQLQITPDVVSKRVSELVPPGKFSPNERRNIPFTGHAVRAIEGARSETKLLAQPIAGTDLLLLAISNQDGSRGARILSESIGDQTLLRSAVMAQLGTVDESESMISSTGNRRVAVMHSTDYAIGTLADPHCPNCGISLFENLRGLVYKVERGPRLRELRKRRPEIPRDWILRLLPLDSDEWRTQAEFICEWTKLSDFDGSQIEKTVAEIEKEQPKDPVLLKVAFCKKCGTGLALFLDD